jgi:hypothetical protein
MAIATVIMNPENLDDIKLIIRGDFPALVFIKARESAVEVIRLLMIAFYQDHAGPLDMEIEGNDYRFSESAWRELFHAIDPWFECYLGEVSPEFPGCRRDSAEVIPLFGRRGDGRTEGNPSPRPAS